MSGLVAGLGRSQRDTGFVTESGFCDKACREGFARAECRTTRLCNKVWAEPRPSRGPWPYIDELVYWLHIVKILVYILMYSTGTKLAALKVPTTALRLFQVWG